MRLTLRNRLILYSITLVVMTIVMAILTASYLISNQTKNQNHIQLENAINSVKSEFSNILPEIDQEFTEFTERKKVNKVLATAFDEKDLLVLKDTFTYVGSVRNHFLDFGKNSKVDDFAFYLTSKLKTNPLLTIQYIKELEGLVIDGNTLYIVDDVEFLNISTVDKLEIFPKELTQITNISIQSYENKNVLHLIRPLKYYGRTIGYYLLRHYLDFDLENFDLNFGLHFNLFDISGKLIDGKLKLNDLDLKLQKFSTDPKTLVDTDQLKYDAILTPVRYHKITIGYVSVSISQAKTTTKVIQTIVALSAIGLLIVLFGIIAALVFINSISKPITDLTLASQAIASGNLQQEINIDRQDELGKLAQSFSHMRDSIIEKIQFIEEQNKTLERRVTRRELSLKEKNSEIESMLQNIDQGFFTILPDLTIHLTYSDQLKDIFQTSEIARKKVMALLFQNCDLEDEALHNIESALRNSLEKGIAEFEAHKHLLVTEFKKTQTDGRILYLETDWHPLLNEDKVIEKIMVTLRDVTETRQLKNDTDQQRKMLQEVGQLNSDPYRKLGEMVDTSSGVRKRNEMIMQALSETGFLTTKELSKILNVSEATVRRDLTRLAELKLIRRSRGGVKVLKKIAKTKSQRG
jgi:HAMP domain-containing protein/DNA-binding transcriptional ArsR family regulator